MLPNGGLIPDTLFPYLKNASFTVTNANKLCSAQLISVPFELQVLNDTISIKHTIDIAYFTL